MGFVTAPMMLMGASAGVSAIGQIRAGQAARAAGNFNASIGQRNAQLLREDARDAIRRGGRETEKVYERGAQIMGAQRAALAARGLDASFGSPLDFILATAAAIELDAETTRENARREARDIEREAWNAETGATMSRLQARQAALEGRLSALGSILDGAAGIARYRATGAFG